MNSFVADPEWHGWIIAYFYLGGIAAGAYAIASMAALFGTEADRRGTRAAYYIAFPLVNLCGLFLTIDLGRPERFWHMLVQSRTGWPMLKWWSPISAGSWGLTVFGAFSAASFLGVLAEDGWFGLGRFAPLARRLGQGLIGRLFEVGGTLSAFFLGAYTGTLLTATNQPIWADTTWLSALFLASSASTGVATLLLLNRWSFRDASHEVERRLERVDFWAIGLETLTLAAFLWAVGGPRGDVLGRWPGILLLALVVPMGLAVPATLTLLLGRRAVVWSAILVLMAGFALRYAIVMLPSPLLVAHAP
jgi:formate-dependent nitrite reductase membrane component NrfD